MNRWFAGAGLVILIVALAILTQGVRKAAPTEDQERQDAQAAQQAQARKAQALAPKTQAPAPKAEAATADSAAGVLPEETVGDPAKAKHHIEVGWAYTDAGEPRPEKLAAALAAVRSYAQRSGGTVSAEIVDLDVPAEDRSPAAQGVSDLSVTVDGRTVLDMNPAEAPPGAVATALAGAVKP